MTSPIRSDSYRAREAYANAIDNFGKTEGADELQESEAPDFENSAFEGTSATASRSRTDDPTQLLAQGRSTREANTVEMTRNWLVDMATPQLRNRSEVVLCEAPTGEQKLLIAQNGKLFDPTSPGEPKDLNEYCKANGLKVAGRIGGAAAAKLLDTQPGSPERDKALQNIACGPREHFESLLNRAENAGQTGSTGSASLEEGTECADETEGSLGAGLEGSVGAEALDESCECDGSEDNAALEAGPRGPTDLKLDGESAPTSEEYEKAVGIANRIHDATIGLGSGGLWLGMGTDEEGVRAALADVKTPREWAIVQKAFNDVAKSDLHTGLDNIDEVLKDELGGGDLGQYQAFAESMKPENFGKTLDPKDVTTPATGGEYDVALQRANRIHSATIAGGGGENPLPFSWGTNEGELQKVFGEVKNPREFALLQQAFKDVASADMTPARQGAETLDQVMKLELSGVDYGRYETLANSMKPENWKPPEEV